MTPLTISNVRSLPKATRSHSTSSALSTSTSSTYSRAAEDMIDRLAAQEPMTSIHLWSAGNLRLAELDLTISARDARELVEAMKGDERFEILSVQHFDEELDCEDWKISFRRTHSPPTTPA